MRNIFLLTGALSLLAACQQQEEPQKEDATISAEEIFRTNFVGKYALEGGCGDGQPTIELTTDIMKWGAKRCYIDDIAIDDSGLITFAAKRCSGADTGSEDRTYTIEPGGMMSVEFISGDQRTSVKRCEAYSAE